MLIGWHSDLKCYVTRMNAVSFMPAEVLPFMVLIVRARLKWQEIVVLLPSSFIDFFIVLSSYLFSMLLSLLIYLEIIGSICLSQIL